MPASPHAARDHHLPTTFATRGPITFAKYMDACLYDPQHGYYTRAEQSPRRDYFTSVDASPIFGRLLARQFQEMWMQLGHPAEFCWSNLARRPGTLAAQILDLHRGVVSRILQCACNTSAVERSAAAPHRRRRDARATPRRQAFRDGGRHARRYSMRLHISRMSFLTLCRSIASFAKAKNYAKFMSAPARMVCANRFGPLCSPALAEYLTEQGIALQEGQHRGNKPGSLRVDCRNGRAPGRGFVLTIDYGHEAQELYDDRHMRGTLLAYEKHRASENFFRAPGPAGPDGSRQFHGPRSSTASPAGLQRTGFTSQSNFLLSLARHSDFADLQSPAMTETQQTRARLLFKTLIYPEGMGETFQILIQHKGIAAPHLSGLDPL